MSVESRRTFSLTIHPWCMSPARDEAVRASEDNRQGPLPTLEECIEQPFADQAKRSAAVSETGEGQSGLRTEAVTERRPPEPKGGGNVTGGLRTERVTLEITRPVFANYPTSAFEFMWGHLLRDVVKGDRESVRVVDTHAEEVAQSVAWEGARDAYRGRIARLTDERDAAIRERDAAKARLSTRLAGGDAMWSRLLAVGGERDSWKILADKSNARADSLTARVAELESQLESVACRAATAENRVAELESAAKLAPAANADGGSNHAPAASGVRSEHALREHVAAIVHDAMRFEREGITPTWQAGNSYAESRARQAALEIVALLNPSAAPAASGAAGTGWLTAEEREALTWWCGSTQPVDIDQLNAWCAAIRNLLARSTPPEVVRPGTQVRYHRLSVEEQRDDQWIAALAAAGVKVKEVGSG